MGQRWSSGVTGPTEQDDEVVEVFLAVTKEPLVAVESVVSPVAAVHVMEFQLAFASAFGTAPTEFGQQLGADLICPANLIGSHRGSWLRRLR